MRLPERVSGASIGLGPLPPQMWLPPRVKKTLIHSFIHYGDSYSAPSRLLLRSTTDPCTAKEKSFEARVKCVRKNVSARSWGAIFRHRKPIAHRGANHRE